MGPRIERHFLRFLVDGPVRCHCGWTPDDPNLTGVERVRAVKEHTAQFPNGVSNQ